MHTPAFYYTPSSRLMPRKISPFKYPVHFEVRYVSANGGIRWNHQWVNVSQTCKGQHVGLEEIEENVWNVDYGPIKLGRFHEQKMRIEDEYGRLERQRRKT
jgi:putative transposase